MKFELFYPQWKDRAVTFSYDDGQIFDRRLVDIFNKYNLKATFHLNSGTLDTEGFIKTQELKSLYQGHEIACHGVAHEYPTHLSQERLVQEFSGKGRVGGSLAGGKPGSRNAGKGNLSAW